MRATGLLQKISCCSGNRSVSLLHQTGMSCTANVDCPRALINAWRAFSIIQVVGHLSMLRTCSLRPASVIFSVRCMTKRKDNRQDRNGLERKDKSSKRNGGIPPNMESADLKRPLWEPRSGTSSPRHLRMRNDQNITSHRLNKRSHAR